MTEETFDATSVGITHHCLLRWLERAKGVDLTAARAIVQGRRASAKHLDKRVVDYIEIERGLSLDPLRAIIQAEVADAEIAVVVMGKDGRVRSYTATTAAGHVFLITRQGDNWYMPTMLDHGMTPMTNNVVNLKEVT